jgi:putative membrane protein insertion efficiency factor
MERFIKKITLATAMICCFIIRCYQLIISPLLGQHCRFEPSCSVYAIQAIQHYGPLRGLWFSMLRLLRCHPWSKAGYDPILPHNKEI